MSRYQQHYSPREVERYYYSLYRLLAQATIHSPLLLSILRLKTPIYEQQKDTGSYLQGHLGVISDHLASQNGHICVHSTRHVAGSTDNLEDILTIQENLINLLQMATTRLWEKEIYAYSK